MNNIVDNPKPTTKHQHYVPQIYLRNFSEDGEMIWSYPFNPIETVKKIPINKICQEKFLYEIRDDYGNYIFPNHIEKWFGKLESQFAQYYRKLICKALKENIHTKCFLTTEEKAFWKLYLVLQILRSPIIIKETKMATRAFIGQELSNAQADFFAVSQLLPFFDELKPNTKSLFVKILEPFLNTHIAIGWDLSGSLFTSDNPVYCYSPFQNTEPITECERAIMPISPELVLILLGGEQKHNYKKNCFFLLEPEDIREILSPIAYSATSRVLSRNKLTEETLSIVEQARKWRKEDELEKGKAK